jgi:TRAP-type C4-dicarboxylate transport system permease small subunit
MAAFNRIVDLIRAFFRVVVILQAAAIFVIIIFTVISRYGFNFVLSWSEEVPRYLLIWISFLGAAISVDLKDHIAFDYFHKRLPGAFRGLVESGINLAIFAFGWIMFFFGYRFVQDFGSDLMESIPYTNVWYYSAMPLSGFLIMLFTVRAELNAWFGGDRSLSDRPASTL